MGSRSPSWGAWIEIFGNAYLRFAARRGRSPSWGAWIEIIEVRSFIFSTRVAPPRGERGLKYSHGTRIHNALRVAPPRGERGLKFCHVVSSCLFIKVAPPRGERGLKYLQRCN